jgi:hypothetical protein
MLESTQVKNNRQCEGQQKFTSASAERPRGGAKLLSTKLDSSVQRYRARFCKAVNFVNYKLTHHQSCRSAAVETKKPPTCEHGRLPVNCWDWPEADCVLS